MSVYIKHGAYCDYCGLDSGRSEESILELAKKLEDAGWRVVRSDESGTIATPCVSHNKPNIHIHTDKLGVDGEEGV